MVQEIFSAENDANQSLLLQTGFTRPLQDLTVADKDNIITGLKQYHCMIKLQAEMDQFCQGLDELGILQYVREHPAVMRQLFVCDKLSLNLTAGMWW